MAYRKNAARMPVAAPVVAANLSLSSRRVAALFASAASWAATWAFIAAIAPSSWPPLFVVALASALEFLLIVGKQELFSGDVNRVSLVSFGFDALLNMGGAWPLVMKLASTETFLAIAKALDIGAEMSAGAGLLIALVAGAWLSWAPHQMWAKG